MITDSRKFWYAGKCSSDFEMIATGFKTFNAPEKDVERVTVLGVNGDYTIDNHRYRNVQIGYDVFICHNFCENVSGAKNWLLSHTGYSRLEDGYNPGHFRMARFTGPLDFDVQLLARVGQATIEFDCMPQRFLISGEKKTKYNAPGTIYNSTAFDALPIIAINGSGAGSVIIGNDTIEILNMTDQIIIDCQTMDAYSQPAEGAVISQNRNIKCTRFPKLTPGDNSIKFNGGVTSIDIIPRWWEL